MRAHQINGCASFQDLIPLGFDAEDLSVALEFTPYGATQSTIFDQEMQELLSKPISYNHHIAGALPEVFVEDRRVNDMYEITSINYDRNGRAFVSSMEARDFDTYPFWGVSFVVQYYHLILDIEEVRIRGCCIFFNIPTFHLHHTF